MAKDVVKIAPEVEERLRSLVSRFRYDAYGFVMAMFPWGVPHTSLAKKAGPEPWQAEILNAVSQHAIDNAHRKQMGLDYKVWRSAVASGHGVGKSALVAWIILWIMSTRMDTRGVVTANTANQLQTKTWPELAKWFNMTLNKHWFTWTNTSLYYAAYPEDLQKNYKVDALTVSPENSEAWAGLHNETSAVFIIFDEASGIDKTLWGIAEGAFTDGEPFFFTFGNPTQPDGPFADCFINDPEKRWWTKNVDSREVSHTNKAHLADLIRANGGTDNDYIRVRVLGQFPSKAYDGFIAPADVTTAQQRELFHDDGVALIMGIDVSRYGDDETVFAFRQGHDARSIPWQTTKGKSTTDVAAMAVEFINKYRPDAVVIESVGPGVGVIDTLRSWNYKVLDVHPGTPSAHKHFLNLRAEFWSVMRDWIQKTGCLPEMDGELFNQLTRIRYEVKGSAETVLKMEGKAEMKGRGLPSPDRADALMLTFAYKIQRRDKGRNANAGRPGSTNRAKVDYDEMNW